MITIPIDKQAHFFSGMALCYTVALLLRLVLPKQGANLIGLCVSVLAGALKEWWWDAKHPTTNKVDPFDFYATSAGALSAFFVLNVT